MKDLRIASILHPALFAALTAVGSFIALPIPGSPVPLVLQNFFVLLAGLTLGPAQGAAAVLIYLLLGAFGFPVFAGGSGGLAHFMGPTGGYLVSYLPAAAAVGLLSAGRRPRYLRLLCAAAAGVLVTYAVGLPWLRYRLALGWPAAAAAGMLPFLPGDALKAAAAAALCLPARRLLGIDRPGENQRP